jgi:hypothetical protein
MALLTLDDMILKTQLQKQEEQYILYAVNGTFFQN